jgi:hypothetical protein
MASSAPRGGFSNQALLSTWALENPERFLALLQVISRHTVPLASRDHLLCKLGRDELSTTAYRSSSESHAAERALWREAPAPRRAPGLSGIRLMIHLSVVAADVAR